MNKHFITGNAGADPETITTETGTKIARFSVACNRTRKNEQGEKIVETDWIRAVAFGKRAEVLGQYLKKGDKIAIVGRVSTSSYQTNEGETRYSTETIVDEFEFLGSAKNNAQPAPDGQRSGDDEDDLPF